MIKWAYYRYWHNRRKWSCHHYSYNSIVEGNVIAKAYDPANNVSTSAPRKATDTTPPTKPRVTSPLGGKAGTTDPVTVTTDPNTNVQLLDKMGDHRNWNYR